MKIVHNVWTYESEIIKSGYIQKAIEILKKENYIYEGVRDGKHAVKGQVSDSQLLLLKTTLFGDEQDRPLTKSNGEWTYFAPDIGYHLNKIERGFDRLICLLGADHDSYAKRIKIATKLMKPDIQHETILVQMVSFESEGCLVKFSKRLGNNITVREFLEKIDPDIFRFMLLSKSVNTQFVFNYEEALSFSMKNRLFYIQYANARATSAVKNYLHDIDDYNAYELREFQNLVANLFQLSDVVEEATNKLAPHIVVNYMLKLAEEFHHIWHLGADDDRYKIMNHHTKIEITNVFLDVFRLCFDILSIRPVYKM